MSEQGPGVEPPTSVSPVPPPAAPPPTVPPPPVPPATAPVPPVGVVGPPGYPTYPYQQYGYAYGAPPVIVRNNGFAVAGLVCAVMSVFAWIFLIPQILAVAFGHIGLGQIRRSGGRERGEGMAIAALVIGYLVLIGTIVFFIAVVGSDTTTTTDY